MSEDKELVEVWRKQFEEWFIGDLDISLKRDKAGNYTFMNAYSAWNAWLEAKRTQPSVVLPELQKDGFSPSYDANELHDKLTASGIKYTIGE